MSDFNFDALYKGIETGILNKDDFGSDENWASAMDIFAEQTNQDEEINLGNIVPGYGQDATWSLYGYGESNPYDELETIDNTEYPLAHGQLLPHLSGKLPPDLIYQLGQGDFEALQYIDDSETLNWAWNRMQSLGEAGAWGEGWSSIADDGEIN